MNILFHAAIGIGGELAMPSRGLFFIGSIAPDAPLFYNEIKIRVKRVKFDQNKVDAVSMFLYRCTHSSLLTIYLYHVSRPLCFAHLLHTVADWFTHTGRFAAFPLFPLYNWQFPWGHEVLK